MPPDSFERHADDPRELVGGGRDGLGLVDARTQAPEVPPSANSFQEEVLVLAPRVGQDSFGADRQARSARPCSPPTASTEVAAALDGATVVALRRPDTTSARTVASGANDAITPGVLGLIQRSIRACDETQRIVFRVYLCDPR